LTNLPATGTYTVVFYTAIGIPVNAQMTFAPDIASTVTSGGSTVSFAASVPSQNAYLTFTANTGDNLEMTLENVDVVGGGTNGVQLNVYNSAGTNVSSFNCYATGAGASCRAALWNLVAGTYTATVAPLSGGTMSFSALLQPDVVGGALAANTPASVSMSVGQIERFTFTGTAGETVALNVAGVSTTPLGQSLYAYVFSPTATTITTSNYYTVFNTGGSTTINLPSLPATGTYTVVFYTAIGIPATAQLTLAPGVTGTVTNNGGAQSYTAGVASQNAYLTFVANAGDNLELTLENVNVTGGGTNGVQLNVYNLAGNSLGSVNCYATGSGASCRDALWNLAAGTYSVIVSPLSGGAMSFSALLQSDVIGGALTANTPASVSMSVGQIERFTFNGTAGETVALNVSGVSTTPSGQTLYAYVFSPTASAITTSSYYTLFTTSSATTLNLPNLPATGTYTVLFYTSIGIPAAAQLTLVPGVTGALTSDGTVQNFATTVSGQNAYLTFTPSAGQNLELTLGDMINANGGATITIYNPSGSSVGDFSCAAIGSGASCRAAVWNTVSGTYTAIVTPNNGSVMSFSALLQPDVIGGALSANTPVTVNMAEGQIERFTFTANAGDTVALDVSGVSTTPSGQSLYAFVFSPTTTTITTADAYTSFSTSSSTTVNLTNLPATGTYTVVFYTWIGIPASGQLTLVPQ